MRLYENLTLENNRKVNEHLNRIQSDWYIASTTPAERQYSFMAHLRNMNLRDDLIFEVYTNTKLK